MRAGAQIISYELSAALSLLTIVLFAGSLDFHEIVMSQEAGWWVWRAPVVGLAAFVIYTIASTAECNRTPFDIVEGESELTAGFHTEYSAMKFAMFFLAEFINIFIVCGISATVFLGGWMPFHIGGMDGLNAVFDLIPPWAWFFAKVSALIFLVMWFRWTFPRLRVDQLMHFEWKFLMPVSFATMGLAAVLCTGGWYFLQKDGTGASPRAPHAITTKTE
jgi:NADH-quinone oxidoreductase subunit H